MDREFRQVLLELELLSHGKAMSWNPTSRGESDDPRPFGESRPAHEEYAELFRQARTEEDCHAVLVDAREYLEQWRGRNRAQEVQEWDEERWIIEDGEGFEAVEVARRFNTNVGRVRKLRLKEGRDGEFGMPYVEPETVDRNERVLFLLGKRMSVRAVAAQVGIPATQVQRIKARRAA
jgi:hypothetical protein